MSPKEIGPESESYYDARELALEDPRDYSRELRAANKGDRRSALILLANLRDCLRDRRCPHPDIAEHFAERLGLILEKDESAERALNLNRNPGRPVSDLRHYLPLAWEVLACYLDGMTVKESILEVEELTGASDTTVRRAWGWAKANVPGFAQLAVRGGAAKLNELGLVVPYRRYLVRRVLGFMTNGATLESAIDQAALAPVCTADEVQRAYERALSGLSNRDIGQQLHRERFE